MFKLMQPFFKCYYGLKNMSEMNICFKHIFHNYLGDGGVVQPQPNGGHGMHSNGGGPSTMHSNVLGPCVDMGMAYDEAIDLEPIDFEHFVDEPDLGRQRSERMFRVSFGDSPPPPRGR